MKIKFDSDDNLPLNTVLKCHILTIIIRNVGKRLGKFNFKIYDIINWKTNNYNIQIAHYLKM